MLPHFTALGKILTNLYISRKYYRKEAHTYIFWLKMELCKQKNNLTNTQILIFTS